MDIYCFTFFNFLFYFRFLLLHHFYSSSFVHFLFHFFPFHTSVYESIYIYIYILPSQCVYLFNHTFGWRPEITNRLLLLLMGFQATSSEIVFTVKWRSLKRRKNRRRRWRRRSKYEKFIELLLSTRLKSRSVLIPFNLERERMKIHSN